MEEQQNQNNNWQSSDNNYNYSYGDGNYNNYNASYSGAQNQGNQRTGLEIASLILGIASIAMACCGCCVVGDWAAVIGIGLAIAAIVCAVKAKKIKKSGMATGGKVCGIIGLIISVIMGILVLCVNVFGMAMLDEMLGSDWESLSETEIEQRMYDWLEDNGFERNVYDYEFDEIDVQDSNSL
ncbi:MAG: DUF4190 domain-containing protein [Lachnospiraceae bacterium]|nr:DUF4190 domain-containing protein [Lachnospiraceae bacterium]